MGLLWNLGPSPVVANEGEEVRKKGREGERGK